MKSTRTGGFTLLEILVALAVLAVTLMAASRAIGLSLQSAEQIKLSLLADWVAQNRLASYRIGQSWPGVGTATGTVTQGGIELTWQEQISATPHAMFRRVDIRVIDQNDAQHQLRLLTGYVLRPQ